ncbi:MAG: hypothetical protein V1720_15045 [bacterium]
MEQHYKLFGFLNGFSKNIYFDVDFMLFDYKFLSEIIREDNID